ncbi:exonuclease 3'-5' domain-containing protein 2 [Phlebotomus argentipes]|uniref:exonuclease 3'-5' domain-containing protein 2 n=1 Tax=Phlebotomus argentipes TaxID=94469 RepID=UPI0028931830|nr:exonuclease 3'-5' domain-containing protein 2 [Phlebotomus argentipes]
MSAENRSLLRNTLVASVGIGLVYIMARYRRDVVRKWRSVWTSNPLQSQTIEVVNNVEQCQRVVEILKNHCRKFQVLGFDCEWVTVNGVRHPIALLQLASHSGLCALFRLSHIRGIPADLRELLEREDIIKVGVAPNEDARLLCADYSVHVASVLDLRSMANLVGEQPLGLSKLSQTFLGIELDKDWRLRCSDWAAPELDAKQLQYAANDAFVAIELFKYFSRRISPRRSLSFWGAGQSLQDTLSICSPFIDISFKYKSGESPRKEARRSLRKKPSEDASVTKESKRMFSTRSRPLYYNCFMQAPDGELLCTMDVRKADWYIAKGLAVLVKQEPYTVQLTFEPSGRAEGNVGDFDKQLKVNQCVVCGHNESYIRKYVVPREYRKFFPKIMKSHSSHDVLLLCTPCHQRSSRHDLDLRQRLAQECNAPLEADPEGSKFQEDFDLKKIKSLALALTERRQSIPEARIREIERKILERFPAWTEVTDDKLLEILMMKTLVPNSAFRPHGEIVVEHFKAAAGLLSLEKLWREHFLTTMKPSFLPYYWSVTHNHERLEIKAGRGHVDVDDLAIAGMDLADNPDVLPGH